MSEALQLHTPSQAAAWLRERGCLRLSSDSKDLQPGDAFFAWRGTRFDARELVVDLVEQGHACLVDSAADGPTLTAHPLLAGFANLKASAGLIADAFYEQASARMDVVAVTGTNGKTSTAWWLSQALGFRASSSGDVLRKKEQQTEQILGQGSISDQKTALNSLMIGTLGVGQPPWVTPAELTTPGALRVHRWIAEAVSAGARSAVMEASSVGLIEQRLSGLHVRVAAFTNFTQDHLDYHGTMAAYWAAKRSLFDWPSLSAAVINLDDPKGIELRDELAQARPALELWTFALREAHGARLSATNLRGTADGMQFTVTERAADGWAVEAAEVRAAAFGEFNASNLLGVIAAQRALGVPLAYAAGVVPKLLPVPGRMERVAIVDADSTLPLALVDYAHTPDALSKALAALRPVALHRGGRLHCVFGCGGDRDRSKRPLMARAVEQGADAITLTQDNPRTEPSAQIEHDVLAGFSNPERVSVQSDRAQAIAQALELADSRDVVLIAGKGHEEYQDTMGVKHPFSDQDAARSALQRIAARTKAEVAA